jgi:hypothetical protein
MAKGRKPGAVRTGHGVMCNICGKNCGKGGPLKKHVEGAHGIAYDDYKKCYYGEVKTILADSWDDRVSTSNGKTVITHILVRRFIGDPGPRGATRAVERQSA